MLRRSVVPESELQSFVEGYRTHGGPVAQGRFTDYLPFVELRTVRNRAGRIVGGYVIAPGEHARCLKAIPPDARARILAGLRGQTLCELNFVWLERELRGSPAAAQLWLRIALDLGTRRGLDRVLYAADRTKPGLLRLYEKVTESVLYQGPLDAHYGIEMDVALFSSTPAHFRRIPRLYARELLARCWTGLRRGPVRAAPHAANGPTTRAG